MDGLYCEWLPAKTDGKAISRTAQEERKGFMSDGFVRDTRGTMPRLQWRSGITSGGAREFAGGEDHGADQKENDGDHQQQSDYSRCAHGGRRGRAREGAVVLAENRTHDAEHLSDEGYLVDLRRDVAEPDFDDSGIGESHDDVPRRERPGNAAEGA